MTSLPLRPEKSAAIAYDCRHFRGDRPCVWHKREGLVCTCEHYAPVRERILVVKLDAMGDVLRTTALLPALAAAHAEAAIDWVTRPESVPLLENNPYLSDVIPYGPDALVRLLATPFDRVINLDAGKTSAGLATLARSPRKDGYMLHEKGYVVASNAAAQAWLEMGLSDDLKRRNRRTYQDIMMEILGLSGEHHYVLELTRAERAWARRRLEHLGLDLNRPVVGLNIGAGGRWELKRWRLEGFAELCERLYPRHGVQLLLLGGKAEQERNEQLKNASAVPLFDAGCDHDVRRFAALTALCHVVVTGDTLAMHVALATRARAVVLFGPTSAPEIELYGLGEKIYPDMECLGCYKTTCDFAPNCMDLISVEMVAAAVERQLALACPAPLHPARNGAAAPAMARR
jgi:heptosyltransferase-2